MSELTGENRENGRFGPGESGNPAGRPKGARNKASILAEQMFEQQVEAVVEKIIERALGGNVAAMRLFLDRAAPQPRDRIEFAMPELRTTDDAFAAQLALITAVAAGEVSPREAERMMGLLEKAKSMLWNRESNARIEQYNLERAAAAAAEATAPVEIFEETAPADTPRPAAATDAAHSAADPVMAGPLAFLDYPDPDGITAGIREVMLKADPDLRPYVPPYNRGKVRRIGRPVPV